MEDHNSRVRAIADRVQQFHEAKIPFRIYHGATNSTRLISKDEDKVVDTSSLSNIISVDKASLTTVVEANVAMDALVDYLLPLGLIPKVVPEFPGITTAGSFSGTAAESSSFREGYFDCTVNWVEIVLADGKITRASAAENEDLFYGAAGALGTLGVVTLLEIQVLRATEHVALTYIPTTSVKDTLAKLKEAGEDASTAFLDAILYTSTQGVILQGRLASSPSISSPIQHFSRPQDPWFFLHAHTKLPAHDAASCRTCLIISTSQRTATAPAMTELIPVRDYLFRYDRGAFWMGSYGWEALPLPFNSFGRRVLDSFFKTRTMYSIMHHSGQSQRFVVQDLAIPEDTAEAFINFCASQLRIWPLWICPIKGGSRVPLHVAKNHVTEEAAGSEARLISIGLWGVPHKPNLEPVYYGRSSFPSFVLLNRMIEAKVRQLGGLKWLYAHNYMTTEEFWESYDHEKYEVLRRKFNAGNLPSIWDKVGKEEHAWQSRSILKGFWHGWLGRDYLLRKK
jgi:hypothetical protein